MIWHHDGVLGPSPQVKEDKHQRSSYSYGYKLLFTFKNAEVCIGPNQRATTYITSRLRQQPVLPGNQVYPIRSMNTCVLRHLTVTVVMVLIVGTLTGMAAGQTYNKGTHYKRTHLQGRTGTFVSHAEIIQTDQESEILIDDDIRLDQNFPLQPAYMVAIAPVRFEKFKRKMFTVRTPYDVFRIFAPDLAVSDDDIAKMMSPGLFPQPLVDQHGQFLARITQGDWEQWQATNDEFRDQGQCGVPVAEVVRVRDILGAGDEEYHPSCILRYKCRKDSGCCLTETHICNTTASEKVSKTVMVTKPEGAVVYYSNITMKTFTVDNDTECGCVENLAPVESECPHPFHFEYAMGDYKCRCSNSFKKICKQIRRGDRGFTESSIRCMKEGHCRPLDNCYHGDFDMTTFLCPHRSVSGSGSEQPSVQGARRREPGRN